MSKETKIDNKHSQKKKLTTWAFQSAVFATIIWIILEVIFAPPPPKTSWELEYFFVSWEPVHTKFLSTPAVRFETNEIIGFDGCNHFTKGPLIRTRPGIYESAVTQTLGSCGHRFYPNETTNEYTVVSTQPYEKRFSTGVTFPGRTIVWGDKMLIVVSFVPSLDFIILERLPYTLPKR